MAKKLGDELKDGLEAPPKKITGKQVREAVESLAALREKITSPTGEKGAEVKKHREAGLNMDAVGLLVKMQGWTEDKLASFYETFTPGAQEMQLGPRKDLFTDTGADEKNQAKRRGKIRDAVDSGQAPLN